MTAKIEIGLLNSDSDKERDIIFAEIVSGEILNNKNCDLIPRGIKINGQPEKIVVVNFESNDVFPDNFRFRANEGGGDDSTEIDIKRREVRIHEGGSFGFHASDNMLVRVTFVDRSYGSSKAIDLYK